VAAGVRRIEALTGEGAIDAYKTAEATLKAVAETLKASPAEVQDKLRHLLDEQKQLQKELADLKAKQATGKLDELLQSKQTVGGVDVVAVVLKDADNNALRTLCDALRDKAGEGALVAVLAGVSGQNVSLAACCSQWLRMNKKNKKQM
jgi:alanyl-tRNA synthetase